jgi:N6-adenosine-specific RNA methylase IME4
MAEHGLLHPVVVTPNGELIAGERRLRAAESLGWGQIPVTVVDLDSIVHGEYAENAHRKDFTLSEAVAIKRALEPLEKAAAKERQGTRTDKHPGNLPTSSHGRASDKAALSTGFGRRTLEKAEAIVDAAEAEPERFGKLLADMDRSGSVNGVFKRLKVAKKAAEIRAESPPLPRHGPYRVAVVDPPWPYDVSQFDPSLRATHPYPQMSLDQIRAIPVASIMHEVSIVWLWTTNYHMRFAYSVLDAWGFREKTILTWAKDRMGTGDWLRGQTEHAILAVRGKPVVELTNQTTLLHGPLRANSQKPVEFYDLVEKLCPAPRYADLFSRYRHNERWDCHGDEAPPEPPVNDGIPPSAEVRQFMTSL